jgi:hypothetical protein
MCRPCLRLCPVPETLPNKITRDDRYDTLVTTKGQDYGPEASIACWRDIIRSGINPADVTVIGINGGEISCDQEQRTSGRRHPG